MPHQLKWALALTTLSAGACAPGTQGRGGPPSPDTTSSARARIAWPILAAALRHLWESEGTFHATHARYTSSLDDLGWVNPGSDVQVAVLWADSAGWRAVAAFRGIEGFLCAITGGNSHPVLKRDGPADTPGCGWPPDELSANAPPPDTGASTGPVREQRPRSDCPRLQLTRAARAKLHSPQTVSTQFVIDTSGIPPVAPMTIWGGTNFWATIGALDVLERCRYIPARVNGRPVRVLIRQPIHLTP